MDEPHLIGNKMTW